MSIAEDKRQPVIEPPRNPENGNDSKLAFFLATALCISAGITGLSTGNAGGFVALGIGALSAIGAVRS
jgi:hypothetical protein